MYILLTVISTRKPEPTQTKAAAPPVQWTSSSLGAHLCNLRPEPRFPFPPGNNL